MARRATRPQRATRQKPSRNTSSRSSATRAAPASPRILRPTERWLWVTIENRTVNTTINPGNEQELNKLLDEIESLRGELLAFCREKGRRPPRFRLERDDAAPDDDSDGSGDDGDDGDDGDGGDVEDRKFNIASATPCRVTAEFVAREPSSGVRFRVYQPRGSRSPRFRVAYTVKIAKTGST